MTHAIATHSTQPSCSPSTTSAARAATPGSRLIRMPNTPAGMAAAGHHLQPVRDHGAEYADGGCQQDHLRLPQRRPPGQHAWHEEDERTDEAADAHPRHAFPGGAGGAGQHDVAGPRRPGEQGEPDADPVDVGREDAEQGDAGSGQPHPDQVPGAPGADQRDTQRPQELDGDGQPDRDAGERLVDRPVHRGQRDAVADHHAPLGPGASREARPGDHPEDHGRDSHPQPRDSRRIGEGEQRLGEGRADLHGHDRTQHEPDRAQPGWGLLHARAAHRAYAGQSTRWSLKSPTAWANA